MYSRGENVRAQQVEAARSAQIRSLNDNLRVRQRGGKMFATQGICSLGNGALPQIIRAIAEFDDFTSANDTYHEHDFGALTVLGHRIMWKIDYYDSSMEYGASDPADPTNTIRILTIMLASEY